MEQHARLFAGHARFASKRVAEKEFRICCR